MSSILVGEPSQPKKGKRALLGDPATEPKRNQVAQSGHVKLHPEVKAALLVGLHKPLHCTPPGLFQNLQKV